MKRACILLSILFISLICYSQPSYKKYPFNEWTKEQIKKANTGLSSTYMTSEEVRVIFLCNLARLDGKLFAKTYLKHYIDSAGTKRTNYTSSLFNDLKKVKGLDVFKPDPDLYKVAYGHAKKSGKTGHVGHKDFKKRYEKAMDQFSLGIAENCDYGNSKALDIVMSLLIDEGISSLGHRINILNKNYNRLGVSIQPHKRYGNNCVMSFGGIFEM